MPKPKEKAGNLRPRNGSSDHADVHGSDPPRFGELPPRYAGPNSPGGPAPGRGPRGTPPETDRVLGIPAERAVWRTTRRGIGPSRFPGLGPERGEPSGALRRTPSASIPGTPWRTFGRRRGLREGRRRPRPSNGREDGGPILQHA